MRKAGAQSMLKSFERAMLNQLRVIEKRIGSTDIRDISRVLTAIYVMRKMIKDDDTQRRLPSRNKLATKSIGDELISPSDAMLSTSNG
jgi:hypothetical protein